MKKANMMISTLTVAVILSFTSGYSSADGICKGMEKPDCTASSSCRWVKGYERSDGRAIAGYCRKLPGKNVQSMGKDAASKKGS
ncbi:hypothetical protein [Thiolapillus sp.]